MLDKENRKKGLMKKTWERCKSMRGNHNQQSKYCEGSSSGAGVLFKSKSWAALSHIPSWSPEQGGSSSSSSRRKDETPEGCFPVYAGEKRERFVMRAKNANHPVFRALLEEAEREYGFCSDGPILLPCDPQVFCQLLLEMQDLPARTCNCSFPTRMTRSPSSYNRLVSSFIPGPST